MKLSELLRRGKLISVLGFDDADHTGKSYGDPVNLAGIFCQGTRFEGMVWDEFSKDGHDSTVR